MANTGIITGQTTTLRIATPGTTQLNLTLSTGEGVIVTANQFSVGGIGQYQAEVTAYPAAIMQGFPATLQIFNATTLAVVGSESLLVPLNRYGMSSQRALISFPVTNTAHVFQLRVVVPAPGKNPNGVDLAVPDTGRPIFQMSIAELEGASSSGAFGDGSDGSVVIAAPAAIARDMYYENLSISAGIALTTAGYRIFVRGTLTMAAAASIINTGGAGGASPAGTAGAAGVGVTVGPGFIGVVAAGGFGAGNAGTAATTSMGGAGGAGGAGAGGAGGAAGAAVAPTAAQGGIRVIRAMPYAVTASLNGVNVATMIRGGAGGGSGGGDGAAVEAGGSGGGAGVILVAAREFAGTGSIEAVGGAGGAGAAGVNAGGGGGGGGGVVITTSEGTLPATITTSVLGGAGGIGGAGGGVAGGAGVAGTAVHVQVTN